MKMFTVASAVLASAAAAPTAPLLGALGYGHQAYAAGPAIHHGTTVQEHIVPAGPAITRTHVQHGVVGHKTVQVGSQNVQVGHQYAAVGQTLHARPDETFIAEPAKAYTTTQALAAPALPYAVAAAPFIPPAPVNLGAAPADTVVQQKILAPGRVHTRITPQVTRIEPELQITQVPYDVIQNIPVPVEREVIVQKQVIKPYAVEVEQPYNVHVPVPVDTYSERYVTPVVHQHSSSVSVPAVAYAGQYAAGYAGQYAGYAGQYAGYAGQQYYAAGPAAVPAYTA